MKNKLLSVMLVSAMVATMLVGCGDTEKTGNNDSDKKTEANADTKKGDKVVLKTVSMFGGTDPNMEAYKAIADKFMADNTNVSIEDNTGTADQEWKAAIAADFAVGNEPDVIQYFTDATANTVLETDKFMTIEEIQKEYPEYGKDITDMALEATTNPDGVNRALPISAYWEGLFCNTDLFEQYNVAIPTDWNSLVTAIKTFKENGIIPIACSLNNVPHYWYEYGVLYTAGTEEYQSTPETAPESWVKGYETIKTLRDLGAFPEDTDTVDDEYVGQLFTDKKAAMQLDGSWRCGAIEKAGNGDTTKVVAFPGLENQKAEPGTLVSGMSSGFYITKKAWDDPAKRDAAVKYVMANTSKEGIQKYWEATGKVQITAAELDASLAEGLSGLGQSAKDLVASATSTVTPTDARLGADPYSVITSNAAKVSTGAADAKAVIDEALALYKELSAE